jgi:hypothetical protein
MFTPSTIFDGIDTNIPTASGGNIHEVFGYVVHEFTASANFIPAKTARYEFFMVGKGGYGQDAASTPSPYGGGGGGGGEVVLGVITLISGSSYFINFDPGSIPSELSFAGIIAYEGGRGGRGNSATTAYNGDDGFSGGSGTGGSGGGGAISTGGSLKGVGGDSDSAKGILNYIYRFGYKGGNANPTSGNGAGGGGGAGGLGGQALSNGTGGAGGAGYPNNWLGSTLYYGGGGGGYPSGTGNGGGGNAATTTGGSNGQPRANSGGGSGGVNDPFGTSYTAASGIVLIRYKTSV